VSGTWFKDDLEILPKVDKKYVVSMKETFHTLEIHNVSLEDKAEYTLEIGEESTTAVVKVQGTSCTIRPSLVDEEHTKANTKITAIRLSSVAW